jgi:hypothetical protein
MRAKDMRSNDGCCNNVPIRFASAKEMFEYLQDNNPEKCDVKRYNGVGGHLFAVAAQRSYEYGFGCAISGFAADAKLMNHYIEAFDAEPICMLHPFQIFIPEESGAKIREVYDYEWTDDII